jgi:hypothetical protein
MYRPSPPGFGTEPICRCPWAALSAPKRSGGPARLLAAHRFTVESIASRSSPMSNQGHDASDARALSTPRPHVRPDLANAAQLVLSDIAALKTLTAEFVLRLSLDAISERPAEERTTIHAQREHRGSAREHELPARYCRAQSPPPSRDHGDSGEQPKGTRPLSCSLESALASGGYGAADGFT